MEGRWPLLMCAHCERQRVGTVVVCTACGGPIGAIPVVPCDDAAVERAARALYARAGWPSTMADRAHAAWEHIDRAVREDYVNAAQAVLAAAGETP